MSKETRARVISAIILAVVIPAGLIARSYRHGADPATMQGFLATYLGDTLWPVLFYFLGRASFPKASVRSLLLATLAITLTLEFSQLWNPPTLHWLRKKPVIGFVLGNYFIWSDVICCLTGTCFAFLAEILLGTRPDNSVIIHEEN